MKKLMLAIALLAIFLVGCSGTEATTQNKEINLGMIAVLSGVNSNFGEAQLNAVQMAIQDKNLESNYHFNLIAEDSKGQPANAISAVHKLNDFDDVDAIIGTLQSGNMVAIAPLVTEYKIPTISPLATSPAVTGISEYVFRTQSSTELQSSMLANSLDELGYKNVAIFVINNNFGIPVADAFKKDFKGDYDQFLFEPDTKDFKTELMAVEDYDALVLFLYPNMMPLVLGDIYELDIETPLFGIETLGQKPVLSLDPKLINDVHFVKPLILTEDKFKNEYVETYNIDPMFSADAAYDAAMILMKSIERCGVEPEVLKKCIFETGQNYHGVSGEITFDANGDAQKPVGLFIIENGEPSLV